MKILKTKLNGVLIIEKSIFSDNRGNFIKIFNKEFFDKYGISFNLAESYYTESKKGVIRGMHFQMPPHELDKIVIVVHGKVLDVILDMRKESPTYGEHVKVELSRENHKFIFIPKGCAHGFLSKSDPSIVFYMVSTEYAQKADTGIRWDSFGCSWPINNPIISVRDNSFQTFKDYNSPF